MDKVNLKKIKEILSKYDIFILFAFLIICFVGPIMVVNIQISDEIWNFHNVIRLNSGLELYKDINAIITPLFLYLGVIFCKIFGAFLFSFRIYNIFLNSLLMIIVYITFKTLINNKLKSLLYTLLLTIPAMWFCTGGANYNVLVVIFYVLGVLFSLNEDKFRKDIYNILQAIIIFLIFMTKQNVMIYYIIGLMLSELLLCKKQYKHFIKAISVKIAVALLLIMIFILTLLINNNLYNFINYTILGIPEFANNISIDIQTVINFGLVLTIVIIGLMSILYKNNSVNIDENNKRVIIKLMSNGVFMILMAYPIFNLYHSMLGSFVIYILTLYLVDIIFVNNIIKNKKYILFTTLLIAFSIFIYSSYYFIKYYDAKKVDSNSDLKIYGNLIMSDDIQMNVMNIFNYIKVRESLRTRVIIFSAEAPIYLLPLSESSGDMDLPLRGNMGLNGEENMLKKIKSLRNVELLIAKDNNNVFWQESKTIRKYILTNCRYVGEIGDFLIYEF